MIEKISEDHYKMSMDDFCNHLLGVNRGLLNLPFVSKRFNDWSKLKLHNMTHDEVVKVKLECLQLSSKYPPYGDDSILNLAKKLFDWLMEMDKAKSIPDEFV